MIFILVIFTAVTLPFVLVRDDRVRKRIYIPLSPAPALAALLMYLRGYNGYSILIVGLMFIVPISFILTAVGVVLAVRARMREQAWIGLTVSTLLASVPLLLLAGLLVVSSLNEKQVSF